MKIAIDISQIVYGSGVSVYTKNLVENLLKIDKKNEYLLCGGSLRRQNELNEFASKLNGNFSTKFYPVPPVIADFIWNRMHTIPIEKIIGKVDVFHSSDWTQPPSQAFKVTTIHDLAPILFPNLFPRDIVRDIVKAHKRRLDRVMREVDRIISPSESTKTDLVNLGFDENKIRVIEEAPSKIYRPANSEQIQNIKNKYHISGNYLLAVGMNPRKNTENIIKAFDLARSGKDLKLIFTGIPKYMKVEENRNIRIAGYVTEEEMSILYSGAGALVYPSFYEGYGLPILEAFACKCPVVTSNISSLPEVAGKAAIIVDPTDVDSIAVGILSALKNHKNLVERGLTRLKNYSWEVTSRKTLAVYNEALL